MVGYEEIIAVLGIVGIGGIIATSLTYVYEKRKQLKISEQAEKEKRYECIVVVMRAILYPDDIKHIKEKRRIPNLSVDDLKNEIRMEFYYSWLFASDDVVRTLKEFALKPDYFNYGKVLLAMRKDLWNKGTNLKAEECTAF